MKIVQEGWLYAMFREYDPHNPEIRFWDGTETKYWVAQGYIPICPYTINIEAPDVDIIEGQIQCLLAKKETMEEKHQKEVKKIDDALATLKCLTFDEDIPQ